MRTHYVLALCAIAAGCGHADPAGALIMFSQDQATGQTHFEAKFWSKESTTSFPPTCATPPNQCAWSACPWGPSGPPGGSSASAGTVTLRGGLVAPPPAYSLDIAPFAKGDALTVQAEGGDFPKFDAQSIVAPGLPVLTAPAAPYAITLAQDLIVTWQGGESNATFFVTATSDDPAGLWVSCRDAATIGSVTMPALLLASLKGATNPRIVWGQERDEWFTVDAAPVEMRAVQLSVATATFE